MSKYACLKHSAKDSLKLDSTAATSWLLVIATSFGLSSLANAKEATKKLVDPDELHSLETVYREISGVSVSSGGLAFLPQGKAMFVTTSWDPQANKRDKAFGPMESQARHMVSGDRGVADLVGADLVGDRWLLLDGTDVKVHEIAVGDFRELIARSLAWDMLKPAADRGGEPTRIETAALRAKFKQQWLRTLGRKLTGWARLGSGRSHGARLYLLATKISGFPLLQMECGSDDEPSSCLITRQCYLEGADDLAASAVAGVGYSSKRRLVYIGDSAQKQIHVFRFDSCFHVARVRKLSLPDSLKKLTNVHVDGDDRLWLTTVDRDDFLNASIFNWPKP